MNRWTAFVIWSAALIATAVLIAPLFRPVADDFARFVGVDPGLLGLLGALLAAIGFSIWEEQKFNLKVKPQGRTSSSHLRVKPTSDIFEDEFWDEESDGEW